MADKARPYQVGDRNNVRLRVGDTVAVQDGWSGLAPTDHQVEIVEIQTKPHHSVLVKIADGSTHWLLPGLTTKVESANG